MNTIPPINISPENHKETNDTIVTIDTAHQDLIDNFLSNQDIDSSLEKTHDTYKELFTPPKPIKKKKFISLRINNPYVDDLLEDIKYLLHTQNDYATSMQIIDDILHHHEKDLTMHEYVDIILDKVKIYNQTNERIKAHEQLLLIEPYLEHFDIKQRMMLHHEKGNIFYSVGSEIAGHQVQNKVDTKTFPIALENFQKIIDLADQMSLRPDIYQITQFQIAQIYVYMHQDKKAITILQEIISMPDSLFTGDRIAEETNKNLKKKSQKLLGLLENSK